MSRILSSFSNSLNRKYGQLKQDFQITIQFKKIEALKLSEKVNFIDLCVVWKRGENQANETKGYELNYLEYDADMDEVFKRISGFYSKKKSDKDEPLFESKYCMFQLKLYEHKGDLD